MHFYLAEAPSVFYQSSLYTNFKVVADSGFLYVHYYIMSICVKKEERIEFKYLLLYHSLLFFGMEMEMAENVFLRFNGRIWIFWPYSSTTQVLESLVFKKKRVLRTKGFTVLGSFFCGNDRIIYISYTYVDITDDI